MPTYIEEDPLRKAECQVYYALQEQLPDDFSIFYSRPWLGLEPDGREVDGETDFTVAHEKLGILTIEVKGGIISRDGRTDQWTSRDGHGVVHNIKNPVLQASKGKYHILKKLNESSLWKRRFINARHGIIFPGSSRPRNEMALGADMPLHIFAFGEDMRWLGKWIEIRMQLPKQDEEGKPVSPLGEDGLMALRQLLASSFQLCTNLGAVFSAEEQKIIQLTEEQYHVLDDLGQHTRLAVAGAAGTGKTLLALEKARRLASRGNRTLFTCYNRSLAVHLSGLVKEIPNLSVLTFHQLCGMSAREAGIPIPEEGGPGGQTFYTSTLPEALVDSIAMKPDLRFDAIVVDEGQDFLPEWWEALQLMLKEDEDGVLYAFYDDNQRVYGHKSRIAAGLPHLPYRLTRNLRNTRQIFETAVAWYQGGITRAAGPHGKEVEWVTTASIDDTKNQVKSILGQLIINDKVPVEDIGVIINSATTCEILCENGMLGRFPVCSIDKPEKGHVTLDTVRRFKGLERNAIIIPIIEPIIEAELIYVALSRARLYLAIIGSSQDLNVLRTAGTETLS